MSINQVALWQPPSSIVVSDTQSNPQMIASQALQLRPRERSQIAENIASGNFELAATFIWARTMALLKKQLASLGSAFIGELLQRPSIDEYTDIAASISDSDAISLARDLGILTVLQTKRLVHSQEIVSHFAGLTNDPSFDESEVMTREEAISCLRVCVQGVLGHENVGAAEDFKSFRKSLAEATFLSTSPEIVKLTGSPYFFRRTAIGVLLSLFRTSRGAQLEHAARNALLIIPALWGGLKDPERWQIGQAYSIEFSEGRKEAVRGLHAVLLAVHGFDYVPESLRSNTFIEVANKVIATHQGMNNFYNEPAPMRELASLGTSIPSPALAACMTAALCVRLGNSYGRSHAAQTYANQVLSSTSSQRWLYYLDGRFDQDRIILPKLLDEKPLTNWIALINSENIDIQSLKTKRTRDLIKATQEVDRSKVARIAALMYEEALGATAKN